MHHEPNGGRLWTAAEYESIRRVLAMLRREEIDAPGLARLYGRLADSLARRLLGGPRPVGEGER